MNFEDIKRLLEGAGVASIQSKVIFSGELEKADGLSVSYELFHGVDLEKSRECTGRWAAFNLRLIQFIEDQHYSSEALAEVLANVQFGDAHWSWVDKSGVYLGEEYNWFFLVAEGEPQAACLIYHPKESAYDGAPIFYIEYVATAPWNRENPMESRRFKGVGSLIIRHVIEFAKNVLGLRYGFSLHALPDARNYYLKIGMESHEDRTKERLDYFEMPEGKAAEFVGV